MFIIKLIKNLKKILTLLYLYIIHHNLKHVINKQINSSNIDYMNKNVNCKTFEQTLHICYS